MDSSRSIRLRVPPMAPDPGSSLARRLREPVRLPGWGRPFLVLMAASVVAQLALITLSVARALPHLRIFLQPAYLWLIAYWACGTLGCLAFLGLFWRALKRPRRAHLAILGLAAFAVLIHAFLAFALQLLLGPGPFSGLGRGLWALFQPGHATAFLTLGVEAMRLLGGLPFAGFGRALRVLFVVDAAVVAGFYLRLWLQAGPLDARPARTIFP